MKQETLEEVDERLAYDSTEEHNPQKIEELIVLKNYDYDGYTNIDQIKSIITLITGRVF